MRGELHLTFNADGWPARKIAMFSLLYGEPPMDTYQEPDWRWKWAAHQYAKWRAKIPLTRWRMAMFRACTQKMCEHVGHKFESAADLEYQVCSRCIQFLDNPDELP